MADLKPITTPVRHRKFLVLDIESKDGASRTAAGFTRPFMVGVYDGDSYHEFRDKEPGQGDWKRRYYWDGGCVDQAMRHILSRDYRGHHIYAHNAGRFDYLFLLPWLMHAGERLGFTFGIIPVSSSIQLLDVKRGNAEQWNRWRFLDSYKLIPTSLDRAAKAFGLPGKVEHNLGLHENDPRWSVYLKQDCVALYQVVEKFHDYVENVLCGEVGITAPSTAVKLFRRQYLKESYPRAEETHEFIREGYVGGRVEVFRKEGHGLRYYDINSSYPAAMLESMPVGIATKLEGEPPPWIQKEQIGFIRAKVIVPDDIVIPPLPIKCNTNEPHACHANGKLIFPVGRLKGVWEWDELQNAVEHGAVIEEWEESVWFPKVKLFTDFVHDLYRYRDKNQPDYDPGLADVVKILLNATYGKFGMKTLRRQIHRWDDPDLPENAKPASHDAESPIWYSEKVVDAAYIMPQISARVTALARLRLWRYMYSAIQAGGDLYYCDTDSVITNAFLESSTELGALKDELPEHSGKLHGRFVGPKVYMLQDGPFQKCKAKGIERPTFAKIEELLSGGTIYQERLEKIGAMAQSGFLRGPRMYTVPRRIRPDLGKRLFLDDGTTVPLKLAMW